MRTDDSSWYSPRTYAFGAIFMAFVAGMKMQTAIVHFRAGKNVEFLEIITIPLFLAISIRWVFLALPLSRKATSPTPN